MIRVSSKDEGTQGTSMKQGSERMVTYAFEEGDASFNSYSGNQKINYITNHRPSKI